MRSNFKVSNSVGSNRPNVSENASLTVIILTFNEEKHITRCINNAFMVASKIFVVDSFSSDKTMVLAESHGAQVWQHEFVNHAVQFEWALMNLPIDTEWVMRVDADEVITAELAENLRNKLSNSESGVNGFLVQRYIRFMGNVIRHGNFPQWNLRIWRNGTAKIENRWMDEHIFLKSGSMIRLDGMFVDDNLNNITWWINKHNYYSSREAIEILSHKYHFLGVTSRNKALHKEARYKRWLKENIYANLSPGFRAALYYFYRMIFQLGFLDGRAGFVFHFLQGFWYRFLVDVKILEVERRMVTEDIDCAEAIFREFGINIINATESNAKSV